MSDDVFSSDQGTTPDNLVDQLVGEGKKFATVNDLALGKAKSDEFIEQLKTEQAALREDLEKAKAEAAKVAALQDVVEKLKPKADSTDNASNHSALTPEELKKLIDSSLESRESERTQQANKDKANQALLAKFDGDAAKAKEHVATKAAELGMSTDKLRELASASPSAFNRLIGLESSTTTTTSTPSGLSKVNTEAFGGPQGSQERTVSYYKELRAKDSKAFWSPKTQQEILKLADSNGGADFINNILNK